MRFVCLTPIVVVFCDLEIRLHEIRLVLFDNLDKLICGSWSVIWSSPVVVGFCDLEIRLDKIQLVDNLDKLICGSWSVIFLFRSPIVAGFCDLEIRFYEIRWVSTFRSGDSFLWDSVSKYSQIMNWIMCTTASFSKVQPIAFSVSFNLNLHSQSPWFLFNGTWQKRPTELDYRVRFEIEETTLQIQQAVLYLLFLIWEYSLLHFTCHFSNLQTQSMI